MQIFNIEIENLKLTQIKEVKFKSEKELQTITEKNLESIFNLDLVSTEFSLGKRRIDTLAFDRETKSFAIIEYKKDKDRNIMIQGLAYSASIESKKTNFIVEYNEKMEKMKDKDNLKVKDVDWSQSKIILLANSFYTDQKEAINSTKYSMELWEVKKYDNGTILYNQLKPLDAAESITTAPKRDTIKDASKEVKSYPSNNVLRKDWEKTYDIYNDLKGKILECEPRLEENFTKAYIGFRTSQLWNVIEVYQQKEKIKVHLLRTRPTDLKKIEGIEVKYKKNSMKHWNQHISDFHLNDLSEVDSAMLIIKQVTDRFDWY